MEQTLESKVLANVFGVEPEVEGGLAILRNAKKGSRMVQYWVKTDGWLTIGPARVTNGPEYLHYIDEKKYKPLPPSFGIEVINKGTMASSDIKSTYKQFQNFVNNGGLTLIDERGEYNHKPGEYVFPKDQIAALGMHRDPSVRQLRPDLEDIVDYECPHGCTDGRNRKRLFVGEQARDQHIIAVHEDTIATEAMTKAVTGAINSVSNSSLTPEVIASIVAATIAGLGGVEKRAITAVQLNKDELEEPDGSLVAPEKRGRGRPRKNPIPE